MTRKAIFIGIYTGNIAIPTATARASQILFVFFLDCPLGEKPKKIDFIITLPGQEPNVTSLDVPDIPFDSRHTRWRMSHAVGIQNVEVRLGKIDAKAVCDGKEIVVAAPWIVEEELTLSTLSSSAPPQRASRSPTASRSKAKKP